MKQSRFFLSTILTAGLCLAKAVIGILSGSWALIADSLHLLGDVVTLLLNGWAETQKGRPSSPVYTFGHHRAEPLIAMLTNLATAAAGIVTTGFGGWEALHPHPVAGAILLWMGGVGIPVYGAITVLAGRGEQSMGSRAVFWHFLGDAVSSMALVLAGGLLAWNPGLTAMDGCLTMGIGLLMAVSAARLVPEGWHLLMEGAPPQVDPAALERVVITTPGVTGLSDLHVWGLSEREILVSGQVRVEAATIQGWEAISEQIQRRLRERFGIHHATFHVTHRLCHQCPADYRGDHTLCQCQTAERLS